MATVALGDLTGRVLDTRVQPHRKLELSSLGDLAADLLAAAPHRQPLAAGVVAPWRDVGWDREVIAKQVHCLLGLDVTTAEHITAMAHAEFLAPDAVSPVTTAFLYARDTAGFVVLEHADDRLTSSRETALNHFPTRSEAPCECGRIGCLIATVGDTSVAQRAYAKGWVPGPRIDLVFRAAAADRQGDVSALLAERAELLVRGAEHVRDMCEPDRLILAGQAFTADPAVLGGAIASLDLEVQATRFGSTIQAHAACAVALQPVDADPLVLAPRPDPSLRF